ncbi:MAG: FAD-binding oxidoreductase [Candidatus Heimdallarchaeota archaeon]|nr:FAD-binding oxidoreductase [Candidatus Heimdallarchaeota archaeon]
MVEYDSIVIGAGSVGVPAAFSMAEEGLKVLCLDMFASPGQGENKKAIGGIRATHTQKGKIWTCQRSIEIFSEWKKRFGEDIEWYPGGYTFVAYSEDHEKLFKGNVKLQKEYGLNINWVDADKIKEIVPGINENGLRGGTYSPDDGNVSPWLAINEFYFQAKNFGADFKFKEKVVDIISEKGNVVGVKTDKGVYKTKSVVNAAGAYAKEVAKMAGLDAPIIPDSHESGITEPIKKFFDPMVVDIQPAKNDRFGHSKNYYFYQNVHGQVVFCITPEPPIIGTDHRETSNFLPQIAQRIVNLLPRLKNLKVRRIWRGLYPMTPDGGPIVGSVNEISGYINAIGMCGQGLMLGPGIGEIVAHIVAEKTTEREKEILEEFSLYRDFGVVEALK